MITTVEPSFVIQDKAVQWLNSMRLGDGGFVSTVDTIVALRALVTYSYHSRFRFVIQIILYYNVVQRVNLHKTFDT